MDYLSSLHPLDWVFYPILGVQSIFPLLLAKCLMQPSGGEEMHSPDPDEEKKVYVEGIRANKVET